MKLSNEAKVGILVTVALVALIWGINYLKGKDLFKSRNTYFAVYSNVDGLVKSNPVFMNGFRIGIINNIEFMPNKSGDLLVTLLINDDIFISKDASAVIYSSDLIGTKALRIDLGILTEVSKNRDTLTSVLEGSLSQQLGKEVGPIKNKTEHLIENVDSVMTLLRLMVDPATQNNLKSGVNHLNNSMAALDNLMNDDKGKLKVMLDNLAQITTNLKNNNAQINTILNNLATVSDSLAAANFAATIRKADQVLDQSAEIMTKINNGEGTIGKLINNEQLYTNLDQTSKDLDELLKDLKSNPKRYVHFSVFGKK